ncbi:uncharacterized protein Gasu_38740 [Galdieria sulphuraria]|uniref:Uncharacterized protein n=1 Tax=Galdieria sulphuraria TaxID=130081 RepID=M2VZA9_GALSU|nr:uncharacterized protein Gasu_38740 [Galdieria sulphuraria]EME28666.1 hypothetical protein Gasu_38740 [Galdieria sulphuraria]|eukprot:XP_005705186.1 hypothetical protein Gasu_38740 [Galdieria sulphuraria]
MAITTSLVVMLSNLCSSCNIYLYQLLLSRELPSELLRLLNNCTILENEHHNFSNPTLPMGVLFTITISFPGAVV